VWVVDDLNPDGFRLHTRQNADLVDLNRNFPYAWAPWDGLAINSTPVRSRYPSRRPGRRRN
jgi:murein tripeptide amidase MpaA